MAKKITYAEPGGYFPASVMKQIEKELGVGEKKPAAKKSAKKPAKSGKK